jgi:hypothetical protein
LSALSYKFRGLLLLGLALCFSLIHPLLLSSKLLLLLLPGLLG